MTNGKNACRPAIYVVQVISEMIISNESNILTSRVLSHFNRSRQLLFTIKLRYKDLEKVKKHFLTAAFDENACPQCIDTL